MTVKELIEELKKMSQDAEIEIVTYHGWDNIDFEPCDVRLRKDGYVEII